MQYPGHQDRYLEPAAAVMDGLVDGLAGALRWGMGRLNALFGHSMGAVVAYELTLRLEPDGGPLPSWLFASGRRGASRWRAEDPHRRADAELLAHVSKLGFRTSRAYSTPAFSCCTRRASMTSVSATTCCSLTSATVTA